MKIKKKLILLIVVLITYIYMGKLDATPMEELEIPAGYGTDIKRGLNGTVEYISSFCIYDFKSKVRIISADKIQEQNSKIIIAKASSVGETRQDRQLRLGKPALIGSEKVVIISEEHANYGIKNILDIFFANAKINDRAIYVVCKGRAEDMLALNVKGYPSSADFIEGMIKHSKNYNFLSEKYNILDTYVTLDSEGDNLVLPYLEINNGEIVFSAMAMFKGEKMVNVLPMNEGRLMNLLKAKKSKGILSIQENPEKYINYDANVKKKVKCTKENGKYEFNIELYFKGDIINNTLYKDINKENQHKFEELMEKKIEKTCTDFVDKMKTSYNTDPLGLGMCAAAKYGRESGVDWNKEVSNSDIFIKAKVKIDKIGRGQY